MGEHPDQTETDGTDRTQEDADIGLERLFEQKKAPELTLDDIPGMADVVQKLRQTVVTSMSRSEAPVRVQSVLFEGVTGAAPDRFATATAGSLASHGFTVYECHPPQARRDRQNIWRALSTVLCDHTPVVVQIPAFIIERTDSTAAKDHLQAITQTNAQIAVLCSFTYDDRRARARHSPQIADVTGLRIEVPQPGSERRQALLKSELKAVAKEYEIDYRVSDEQLERFAGNADGFTHDDCQAVVKRAAVLAMNDGSKSSRITASDLSQAIDHRHSERPNQDTSRQRSDNLGERYQPDIPNVTFEDVGGLDGVIDRFEHLLAVHGHRDVYTTVGQIASPGVLLYGPPGTGKTRLAKAATNEFDRTFFAVEGAAIKNKWFGESERTLRRLFTAAKEEAPSLLFLDELDALAPRRSDAGHSAVMSIVTTLLAELDGLESRGDVVVIGATNRRDGIDPAVLRPGRLGTHLEVPPPDTTGQKAIFEIHTRELSTEKDVSPEWFTRITPETITGAEIGAVIEEAVYEAVSRRDTSDDLDSLTLSRTDVREGIERITDDSEYSGRGFA